MWSVKLPDIRHCKETADHDIDCLTAHKTVSFQCLISGSFPDNNVHLIHDLKWISLLFVSLYITKRSETVLQWGKRKNIKKLMINGELVIEWKKEKSIKDVVVENICYD